MRTTNNEIVAASNHQNQIQVKVPFRASVSAEFGLRRFSAEPSQRSAMLREHVTAELAKEYGSLSSRLIYQVVNEADSLAATTAYPTLLLPALAEEKVRSASEWAARQQVIRNQTLALAA